jgi:phosphonoacetate hydrolase
MNARDKLHQDLMVNQRSYAWPRQPVVVICLDGCEPDYIAQAVGAGVMPTMKQILNDGEARIARSAMPSFTNPNNLSIATGVSPALHGICGNYLYDPQTDAAVLMNDPKWLRAPTLFSAFSKAGARVAVVTAKDKLRRLLGHELKDGICFSAEKADQATRADGGIDHVLQLVGLPLPEVYSSDLSEFVFAAGVRLLQTQAIDLLYLSTTDYVQHKFAPATPEANRFYAMFDGYLSKMLAEGALVAITADHGMNAKVSMDGSPNVIYLQDLLDQRYPSNSTRVILPITDPYVVHHGALGSFATIYRMEGGPSVPALIETLMAIAGIDQVLSNEEAANRFELPQDRIGDLVVTTRRDVVVGTRKKEHDLTGLTVPLRSHGGTTELAVPLIVSARAKRSMQAHELRNFDVFWFALNYCQEPA